MIKSMTGFASVSREHKLATIGVTVRSVNHRYLDVQVRVSRLLAAQETALRGLVQRRVALESGRVLSSRGCRPAGPPRTNASGHWARWAIRCATGTGIHPC